MITEALSIVKGILVNHKKNTFLLHFGAVQTKCSGATQVSF